jgi:2-oxoglutarate ferredoxin oxidoreductase subunit beta
MIDVISPCVTFNDHEGSTKSYKYSKDHEEPIQEVGFVPSFENIDVDYDPGTTATVRMHDGSQLRLRKLDRDYDATSKVGALRLLSESHEKGEMLTGVFYVNTTAPNFIEQLNLTEQSLARMTEDQVRPSRQALDEMMEELR